MPDVTSWVTVRESKGGGGLQGVPSISIHDLDALSPFEPGKAVIKKMKKSAKIRLFMMADDKQLGRQHQNKFEKSLQFCQKRIT